MKNYFLLSILSGLLLQLPASAQNGGSRLLTGKSAVGFMNGITPYIRDSFAYEYDAGKRQTKETYWNSAPGMVLDLKLYSRYQDYIYDNENNLLSVTYQQYSDSTGWINNARNIYTYNPQGLILTFMQEAWMNGSWQPSSNAVYTYDAEGHLLSNINSGNHIIYTYNAQGLKETETTQIPNGGNWVNSYRYVYYYDNQNVLTGNTEQFYFDNTWYNLHRDTIIYDASGNIATRYTRDWGASGWTNNYRDTYEYDANNNLLRYTLSQWLNGAYKEFYRVIKTYDNESYILTSREESRPNSTWVLGSITKYYYDDLLAASGTEPLAFEVFPNPATSFATIKGAGLQWGNLVNMEGRSVSLYHLNGQAESTISLGNLPVGNYFLQVKGQNGKVGIKQISICR